MHLLPITLLILSGAVVLGGSLIVAVLRIEEKYGNETALRCLAVGALVAFLVLIGGIGHV